MEVSKALQDGEIDPKGCAESLDRFHAPRHPSPASRPVYVEPIPRIERVADRLFEGEEAVLHVIERIVAPLGLRVDATSPWVDARLPDGSRVQTNFLSTPFLPPREA
jgi:hypothetical protein